jgi:lipoprotein NlpI
MRRITVASALLVAALAGANAAFAEGALAVGMPEGNPARGFKWNIRVNTEDPAPKVMDACHTAKNPRTGAACKLIGAFTDQCVAVTSNGEPTTPVTAAGWAIAPDPVTATKHAMARCEAMRKGRGPACRLDGENALLCDGKADDKKTCANESGDVAIAACSRAIASGRYRGSNLAELYTNRGVEWRAKGDNDRAIADYTEAISLDPKYAVAYNNRGLAWSAKGDLDRAIADYDSAIQLDPKNALAYDNRGKAWKDKGNYERAIADYNEVIRLDPKYATGYFSRGRANLYAGALPKALADLNQASELNPKHVYTALWLDIVKKRSKLPSGLAEATKQIDMTKWPAPVVRLYLGQLTPEAVLDAADDPNAETKKGKVCEANFYTGELALQQGKKDEARRLFGLAAADCPKGFVEYEGAKAELQALEL